MDELTSENINFNTGDNIDEDEVEIQLSTAELIEQMEEAWLNEKFSPEILPHKTELIEILLGQINYREEKLSELESTDFKRAIYQMEVDRLRFLVTSYLRMRLEKIETYSSQIFVQERLRAEKGEDMYLNQNELEFIQDYEKGINEHIKSILAFCPDVVQPQLVVPNLHSMVFLKSKENIDGVIIDDGNIEEDGDLIDLTTGSQIIISYASVADLLKNGHVHLI